MKRLYIIPIMLGLICCTHISQNYNTSIDISIICDKTDRHLLSPEVKSIIPLYNFSQNKSQAARFRYKEITDKQLVPVVDVYLPPASMTSKQNLRNEPMFREKLILKFYDTIGKTLRPFNTNRDSNFLDHSECFRTIADELIELSESMANNKILLVFSNLFENSTITSVYKSNRVLIQNLVEIKEHFENAHRLPQSLNGIKVLFLFRPQTRQEDQMYLEMVYVYKKMIEARGGTVRIEANTNYQNLFR